jgi:hypothetical protein
MTRLTSSLVQVEQVQVIGPRYWHQLLTRPVSVASKPREPARAAGVDESLLHPVGPAFTPAFTPALPAHLLQRQGG